MRDGWSFCSCGSGRRGSTTEAASAGCGPQKCIHGNEAPCNFCEVLPAEFRGLRFDGVDVLPYGGLSIEQSGAMVWMYRAACQAIEGVRRTLAREDGMADDVGEVRAFPRGRVPIGWLRFDLASDDPQYVIARKL